jgi:hypothetical protein
MRSENYGQARADEGTLLVAVLAGRITGGHEDEVTDLVRLSASPAIMAHVMRLT